MGWTAGWVGQRGWSGGHLASWLLRASSYGGTGIACSVAFAAAAAAVGSVAASSRAAQSEVSTFAVSAGRSSAAKVAPLVVAPGLCWTSHFPCSSTNASGKGREATELRYALMWSCAWKRRDDKGEASDVGKMRSKRSESGLQGTSAAPARGGVHTQNPALGPSRWSNIYTHNPPCHISVVFVFLRGMRIGLGVPTLIDRCGTIEPLVRELVAGPVLFGRDDGRCH